MKSEELKKLGKYKCEVCGKKATSIVRTMYACSLCFRLMQRDNIRLINSEQDIQANTIIKKNCFRYRCTNRIIGKITYEPEYCSKECEETNKRVLGDYYPTRLKNHLMTIKT